MYKILLESYGYVEKYNPSIIADVNVILLNQYDMVFKIFDDGSCDFISDDYLKNYENFEEVLKKLTPAIEKGEITIEFDTEEEGVKGYKIKDGKLYKIQSQQQLVELLT